MVPANGVAQAVTGAAAARPVSVARLQLWAVDRLMLGYLAGTAVLVICFWRRLPQAPGLVAWHVAGGLLIVLAGHWPAPRISRIFHHWYPVAYVSGVYKEMSILIPVVRGRDFDLALAHLDFALWGVNPTVWMEALQTPLATELLQLVYSSFLPGILLIAAWFWKQRRLEEFRYYAFLITLGFLASYIGYLLIPARGPRFVLQHLQRSELQGLWSFQAVRKLLDRLESAHYDCFPSGHIELTILAWWSSRRISTNLFWFFFVYTCCIIFATVYLRYHYTVDLMAGAVLALVVLVATPFIYRDLERGR